MGHLVADLDADRYAVRQRATADLEQLGAAAESFLREALEHNPSLELRRRAEALLRKLQHPVMAPDELRTLRAVEVVEHIGDREAGQLLTIWAQAKPGSRLAQEAGEALGRLRKRAARGG